MAIKKNLQLFRSSVISASRAEAITAMTNAVKSLTAAKYDGMPIVGRYGESEANAKSVLGIIKANGTASKLTIIGDDNHIGGTYIDVNQETGKIDVKSTYTEKWNKVDNKVDSSAVKVLDIAKGENNGVNVSISDKKATISGVIGGTKLGVVMNGGDVEIQSDGKMNVKTLSNTLKGVTSINQGKNGIIVTNGTSQSPTIGVNIAGNNQLGTVKEGEGGDIDIDATGIMTVKETSKGVTSVSGNANGLTVSGGQNVTLSMAKANKNSIFGTVSIGENINVSDGVISVNTADTANNKLGVVKGTAGDIKVNEDGSLSVETGDNRQFVSALEKKGWNDKYTQNQIDEKFRDVNAQIAGAFHFKGVKATKEELDAVKNANEGDVWQVTEMPNKDRDVEFAWVKKATSSAGEWIEIGSVMNLSEYAKKGTTLAEYGITDATATKDGTIKLGTVTVNCVTETELTGKNYAVKGTTLDHYGITDATATADGTIKLGTVTVNCVTETELTEKNYAVKGTTLAHYGINDAYTISQIDKKLSLKQDNMSAGTGITFGDDNKTITNTGVLSINGNSNGLTVSGGQNVTVSMTKASTDGFGTVKVGDNIDVTSGTISVAFDMGTF